MADNDAIAEVQTKHSAPEEDTTVERDRDAWMDTLSDLIFLMITFFVLLITMSSMDNKALQEAFGLFDDAAGVLDYPNPRKAEESLIKRIMPLTDLRVQPNKKNAQPVDLDVYQDLAREFLKGVKEGVQRETDNGDEWFATLMPLAEQLEGKVAVLRIEGGVEVVVNGRLLFAYGSNTLLPGGAALLDEIAGILRLWGGDVRVVAWWNWEDGPAVLTEVLRALTRRNVAHAHLDPQLVDSMERKIRFVLRKESDDGQ